MTHEWDEFSKLLAEPVPRRESLRRLGALLGGAVLGPLATRTARAGGKRRAGNDPCKSFCKCSKKKQQNACLDACRACNGDTSRVCGACGSHSCANGGDTGNCGACGHVCAPPGLYEDVRCVEGMCVYECIWGTVRCGGVCIDVQRDRYNCGACGNSCGELETCVHGTCRDCNCYGDGVCQDLLHDVNNCGTCGVQCPLFYVCSDGFCTPGEVSPFPS
jgi:hypothetical protein